MKLFLLIILFACFVFFAFFLYSYYSFRKILFKDLVYICTYLKNNILFNKENIHILIVQAKENISISSRYLIDNNNSISKFIIKKDQSSLLKFFDSLGTGDVDFELNNIRFYEEDFKNKYVIAGDELKIKGNMWFKLIISLGLIICIMLI